MTPTTPYTPQDVRRRTASGVPLTFAARLFHTMVRFALGIVLARLLTPDAFGVFGMAMLFVAFADVVAGMGLGPALVQRQNLTDAECSTGFWLNVATGVGLMLLFVGAARPIAGLFGIPLLEPIVIGLSLSFVIRSAAVVQISLLTKRMEFRRLAFLEIVSASVAGATGIAMAYGGWGVWSLVGDSIVFSASRTVMAWALSGWRPALRWDWSATRELLWFGWHSVGFSATNYWLRHADHFVVGRFLGAAPLGLYSRAYSLVLFPVTAVTGTCREVMFPALAAMVADRDGSRRLYCRMARTVAFVTWPTMLGLVAVADSFVLTVFGDRWSDMIPIVRLFAIVAAVQSISMLNGAIYLSQRRPDLQFGVSATLGVLGVTAIVTGLPWGIVGVAVSYTVYALLASGPALAIPLSLIGLRLRDLLRSLAGVAGCTTAMAATLTAVGHLLPDDWAHPVRLIAQVSLGIASYWAANHLFRTRAYVETGEFIQRWRQTAASPTVPTGAM